MNIANVIIVDDDAFVRSSLSAGLRAFSIRVVGTAVNFATAYELCKSQEVDVAIVDLDLGPGPSGIDICHSLRKQLPSIGLVLLTSYRDPKIADPNMQSLPKGTKFVSKTDLSDFQTLVSEVLAAKTKPLTKTHRFIDKSPLTQIQLEVLKMVSEGLSTSEIAERRGVSPKAIEGIISKIHDVLKIGRDKSQNQRVQLTRAYFRLSGKKPPGD
jgi:two-component system, NarL family, invasion response regulator UvrY